MNNTIICCCWNWDHIYALFEVCWVCFLYIVTFLTVMTRIPLIKASGISKHEVTVTLLFYLFICLLLLCICFPFTFVLKCNCLWNYWHLLKCYLHVLTTWSYLKYVSALFRFSRKCWVYPSGCYVTQTIFCWKWRLCENIADVRTFQLGNMDEWNVLDGVNCKILNVNLLSAVPSKSLNMWAAMSEGHVT